MATLGPLLRTYTLEFDGVDDYVDLGAPFAFGQAESFTAEAWVYNSSAVGNEDDPDILGKGRFQANSWSLWFRGNEESIRFELNDDNNNRYQAAAVKRLPEGRWVHLAGVYDAAAQEARLYVDGALEATRDLSAATGGFDNADNVLIAKRQGDNTLWFNGRVAECRIWAAARTQTQIQDWMDRTLDGDETGLEGYWKLDEGSGSTVTDSTSSNNDGTINGAAWVEPGVFPSVEGFTSTSVDDHSAGAKAAKRKFRPLVLTDRNSGGTYVVVQSPGAVPVLATYTGYDNATEVFGPYDGPTVKIDGVLYELFVEDAVLKKELAATHRRERPLYFGEVARPTAKQTRYKLVPKRRVR